MADGADLVLVDGHVPAAGEERIDLHTAIAAFTMGSAYVNDLDHITLDRNLVAGPVDEIGGTRVDLTMVDGAVVFDRGAV
ncbi:MAG: hypothetical protein U0V56_01785 [Actinomycetota bacterium]